MPYSRAAAEQTNRRQMLQVLALFRVIFKSVRKHYHDVRRSASISGAQLWALSIVASRPNCKVGEIAKQLSIHQSTASNLVRNLEESGLVTRKRFGSDRREVQLSTTAKGKRILKKAPKPLVGVLQFGLSRLSAKDLLTLQRQLSRLTDLMNVERAREHYTVVRNLTLGTRS